MDPTLQAYFMLQRGRLRHQLGLHKPHPTRMRTNPLPKSAKTQMLEEVYAAWDSDKVLSSWKRNIECEMEYRR